jgi:hypothetical protein
LRGRIRLARCRSRNRKLTRRRGLCCGCDTMIDGSAAAARRMRSWSALETGVA